MGYHNRSRSRHNPFIKRTGRKGARKIEEICWRATHVKRGGFRPTSAKGFHTLLAASNQVFLEYKETVKETKFNPNYDCRKPRYRTPADCHFPVLNEIIKKKKTTNVTEKRHCIASRYNFFSSSLQLPYFHKHTRHRLAHARGCKLSIVAFSHFNSSSSSFLLVKI